MANVKISDIEDRDSLEEWLKDQPVEWAQAIAARVALRVAPFAFSVASLPEDRLAERYRKNLVLLTFRALLVSSAASTCPDEDLSAYAAARAANAYAAARAASAYAASAYAAAYAAARAANAYAAARAANAYAAARAASAYAASDVATDIWESIRADCGWLVENGRAEFQLGSSRLDEPNFQKDAAKQLMRQPLWLEEKSLAPAYHSGMPDWAEEEFEKFTSSELCQTTSFGLIEPWYRAALKGQSAFGKDRDLAIAKMAPKRWGDGRHDDKDFDAVEVMDEVARIAGWERGEVGDRAKSDLTINEVILRTLETIGGPVPSAQIYGAVEQAGLQVQKKSVSDSLSRLAASGRIVRVSRAVYGLGSGLSQPPAPYNFAITDKQVDVSVPEPTLTVSKEFRDDQWQALKDALNDFADAKSGSNASVSSSMESVLDRLVAAVGEIPATVRPGVLQSLWRKMSREMEKLAKENGTGSQSLDDALNDIADGLEDLRVCYEDTRDQEKAMIRLGISSRNVDQILLVLEKLAHLVDEVGSELFSDEAQRAIGFNIELIKSEPDKETAADLAADQLLTDQALATLLLQSLRLKDIPSDIRDEFVKDIAANRDGLVKFAGKLPTRSFKALLSLFTLDYFGVFSLLEEQVPSLSPLLQRLRRILGRSKDED